MIWGAQVELSESKPGHQHDMLELGVSLGGVANVTIGRQTFAHQRGKLFFYPSQCFHQASVPAGSSVRIAFLCFDRNYFFDKGNHNIANLVDQLVNGQHYCSGHSPDLAEENVALVSDAVRETKTLSPYAEDKVEALLIQLLINFARGLQLAIASKQSEHRQRLLTLCKQINKQPGDCRSLQEAAKFAGVSRTGFMVLFRELTGMSYIEYINLAKVKKAMKLCENRDLSVSDIADQAGFRNLGHFHKTFKRICKMTPLQFKTFVATNGPFPTILDYA